MFKKIDRYKKNFWIIFCWLQFDAYFFRIFVFVFVFLNVCEFDENLFQSCLAEAVFFNVQLLSDCNTNTFNW